DEGETTVYASSYSFNPARIEFSETDEAKDHSMYYVLEAISDNLTRVTIEYYINKGILNEIAFNLRKKATIRAKLERSMERLTPLAKQLNIPTEY
ncbi:MAG TPA: hypothetical protein VHM26_03625, partial [Chitinophagaceae bacterium]|nr:hypothetical protein [Chitinophagaceae bacterium]